MRRFLLLLALVLAAVPLFAATDKYGGDDSKKCASTTPPWHHEVIDGRVWTCDPLGNVFWYNSQPNFLYDYYNNRTDFRWRVITSDVLDPKYGDHGPMWGKFQVTRLKNLGYTVADYYSQANITPWFVNSSNCTSTSAALGLCTSGQAVWPLDIYGRRTIPGTDTYVSNYKMPSAIVIKAERYPSYCNANLPAIDIPCDKAGPFVRNWGQYLPARLIFIGNGASKSNYHQSTDPYDATYGAWITATLAQDDSIIRGFTDYLVGVRVREPDNDHGFMGAGGDIGAFMRDCTRNSTGIVYRSAPCLPDLGVNGTTGDYVDPGEYVLQSIRDGIPQGAGSDTTGSAEELQLNLGLVSFWVAPYAYIGQRSLTSTYSASNPYTLYSDPTVQVKQHMRDFFKSLTRFQDSPYGTANFSLAKFNRYLGSYYTGMGSDGVDRAPVLIGTAGASSGCAAGDPSGDLSGSAWTRCTSGTTNFSTTLSEDPDPYTIQIRICEAGAYPVDCAGSIPLRAADYTTDGLDDELNGDITHLYIGGVSTASGTFDRTTGALTLALPAGEAPPSGASVYEQHRYGGWGKGKQLLDENGVCPARKNIPLVSIVGVAGTVTVTLGANMTGTMVGDSITIAGTSNYNGAYTVLTVAGTDPAPTVTVAKAGSIAQEDSVGTMTNSRCWLPVDTRKAQWSDQGLDDGVARRDGFSTNIQQLAADWLMQYMADTFKIEADAVHAVSPDLPFRGRVYIMSWSVPARPQVIAAQAYYSDGYLPLNGPTGLAREAWLPGAPGVYPYKFRLRPTSTCPSADCIANEHSSASPATRDERISAIFDYLTKWCIKSSATCNWQRGVWSHSTTESEWRPFAEQGVAPADMNAQTGLPMQTEAERATDLAYLMDTQCINLPSLDGIKHCNGVITWVGTDITEHQAYSPMTTGDDLYNATDATTTLHSCAEPGFSALQCGREFGVTMMRATFGAQTSPYDLSCGATANDYVLMQSAQATSSSYYRIFPRCAWPAWTARTTVALYDLIRPTTTLWDGSGLLFKVINCNGHTPCRSGQAEPNWASCANPDLAAGWSMAHSNTYCDVTDPFVADCGDGQGCGGITYRGVAADKVYVPGADAPYTDFITPFTAAMNSWKSLLTGAPAPSVHSKITGPFKMTGPGRLE